ncbi:uncharacterized protein LOC120255416 [Dioscorea cayenensis subsp. rotundata]|uniref:Uncharacterized protein LOC120255416 n=1 Tax=Dioscorea cayennensis subsp. rotundata TaxID=55577 RepID=A0AB40AVT8_DIOCR|nr:uncharacterized protein LOC120255416 [Dioscorea cayenensis subsp. rotundata]
MDRIRRDFLWSGQDIEKPKYRLIQDRLRTARQDERDRKYWSLTGNKLFSVKSLYNFLNDGGLCCEMAKCFWKNNCPKKINIFNWMVWKNKILSLENLATRRCNSLPTTTCVMCHAGVESVDHLFLQCLVVLDVWGCFNRSLSLPGPPTSMCNLWLSWRTTVRLADRIWVDLVVKVLVWNLWLARNDRIFNAKILPVHCIVLYINRMLLLWFDALADLVKVKIEDTIASVRRSLEFVGQRSLQELGDTAAEEAPGSTTE